jgi:quercetin dioxygenase-like cupin family protein
MKKISLSEAPNVPHDLEGYIMHSSSTLEIIHLCLHPGQIIAQHPNPFDVVACVIAGEVELNIDENHTQLSLYDVVEIENKANRGFTNKGTSEARLLILKKIQV